MFVECAWLELIPWWLTAAVVARDVLIGLGALIFRLWFGPLHGRPTLISKVNTAAQLMYVMLVLLHAAERRPPREVLDAGALITFATTVISGLHYVAPSRGAPGSRRRAPESLRMRQIPLGVRLPDRAVFASFLPGPQRRRRSSTRSARRRRGAGLTWLCGPPGSGKTHLLQAICAAASERRRAGYVPLARVAALGVGVLDGLPQLRLPVPRRHRPGGRAERVGARRLRAAARARGGGRAAGDRGAAPPALLPWTLAGSRLALRGGGGVPAARAG